MDFWFSYGIGGAVIVVLMTLLWGYSLRIRDAGIADVFWGVGFVVLCWLYALLAPGAPGGRAVLACGLVTVWGLRLALHIAWRSRGQSEDFRYRRWRQEHGGAWWWRSYLQVFLLQGALLWIISAPLLAVQSAGKGLGWLDAVAAVLWSIGFFFEAVGDAQLVRFKADPAHHGQVLQTGLWRYTRHPNYFGDALQWWAFYLLAVAAGGAWTVFSPVLMTYLLLRVSGVTMLERTMASRPGYHDYIKRTNAFFPWRPREHIN